MLFSLRRKAPKDSLRLSPQTPSICWQAHTHGSKGVAVLAQLAQATTRRAGRYYEWKARARRRKAAGAHSLSVRRVPPWIARVYECKHVSGADGMRSRLALTVKPQACGFFSFFSCPHKKRTRFSFPKEKRKSPNGDFSFILHNRNMQYPALHQGRQA